YPERGQRGGGNPLVFSKQKRTTELAPACRQLLFRTRGLVDITAADDGEFAEGNNAGGVFTRALRKSLESVWHDNEINWTAYYPKLKKATIAVAKESGQPPQGKLQSSRAFHLPSVWGFLVDKDLVVVEIHSGSAAERNGLRRGERISGVNG